jgi:hypothetical protein
MSGMEKVKFALYNYDKSLEKVQMGHVMRED